MLSITLHRCCQPMNLVCIHFIKDICIMMLTILHEQNKKKIKKGILSVVIYCIHSRTYLTYTHTHTHTHIHTHQYIYIYIYACYISPGLVLIASQSVNSVFVAAVVGVCMVVSYFSSDVSKKLKCRIFRHFIIFRLCFSDVIKKFKCRKI